jgi:2-dehydro-3-deoxygluconokinase
MNLGFTIPEQGSLDLLSLGALVHRLDPGIIPFRKATRFAIHVSGGEFNVAGNLADAFGQRTGIATAMVSYPIGDLISERVRGMGVRPFYKRFEHDGTRGPNMATVYSDQGLGVRAPVVFYNRSNEAAALLKPGDFDWKAIFAEGVRWFHSGGIFASLSETTAELVIEAMKAARAAGVICSFDLNYREKLWKTVGGMKRAHQVLGAIVDNVDVLVGNEEDLQKGLGFAGPEVAASSKLDTGAFLSMIEHVVARHPQIKVVATTLREVHSTNHHSWSAVAWVNGEAVYAPTCELNVLDRVGGGDGFASGFIYGLLSGETPQEAIKLGWAHGALMTTFPGDTTMATVDQVKAFASGGSARIQR